MTDKKIDDLQLDQLKEIVNIGASHASTALSQMINEKVDLTVPEAYVDEIHNINKYVKGKTEEVVAALLKIYGDASGVMFFMFDQGDEQKLAKTLVRGLIDEKNRKELEMSAIGEMANVLAGASLTAFSKFLNMNLLHTVSNIVVDTVDSITNSVAVEIGKTTGRALVFQVNFEINKIGVKTNFLFFFDPSATKKILEAIKNKY